MRILLVIILMTLTACVTAPRVINHDSQTALAEIKLGEWVEVIKRDGEEVGFWVTEVTDTGIAGAEGLRRQGRKHDIAYTDMQALTLKRTDAAKTALAWTLGIALIPAAVAWPAFPIGGGY